MTAIGIQLPEVERDVRWPELRAMAIAAEEVGFDSVWLGDHLLYRGDDRPERAPWDAWTTMAALAGVTDRLRIGPLVACAAFHPPGMLARMAASLDEISRQRFVLGIGAGWNRTEFDAFGIPYDHRASRFEEAFAIVRGLLAGERVTFQGRFHRVDDAVLLPTPSRRVPIMLGSNGDRLLRFALGHVDAWNTWFDDYGNRPDGFARLNARISDVARGLGRDPDEISRSACALVVLDPDTAERRVPDGVDPVFGTTAAMASRLRELADAGADEVVVVASPITEASIRTLGDVVASLR
ncbi:MAG TPA: LLM class flavin-dependent oxidoreductase [Actinomycetota bacterium]|nr:LLM class flavin-dependent oxidoreductase [Actinomycetota bacterium]